MDLMNKMSKCLKLQYVELTLVNNSLKLKYSLNGWFVGWFVNHSV